MKTLCMLVLALLLTSGIASAAMFNFTWEGTNGYSASGFFETYDGYDIISADYDGYTNEGLKNLQVSFSGPGLNLTVDNVVDGVMTYQFLLFYFNTLTMDFFNNLDIGKDDGLDGDAFLIYSYGNGEAVLLQLPDDEEPVSFGGAPQVTQTAVPLPAAVWLLGSGLIGLAGLRRRVSQ